MSNRQDKQIKGETKARRNEKRADARWKKRLSKAKQSGTFEIPMEALESSYSSDEKSSRKKSSKRSYEDEVN